LYKEDDWKGMLRMKLREGCKRLGMQGIKFGRVHLPLLSYFQMTPLEPLLYGENMVNYFSEGPQEVIWLCNLT
jgi:hypothetical protein